MKKKLKNKLDIFEHIHSVLTSHNKLKKMHNESNELRPESNIIAYKSAMYTIWYFMEIHSHKIWEQTKNVKNLMLKYK